MNSENHNDDEFEEVYLIEIRSKSLDFWDSVINSSRNGVKLG
jgi:hypothetical protein